MTARPPRSPGPLRRAAATVATLVVLTGCGSERPAGLDEQLARVDAAIVAGDVSNARDELRTLKAEARSLTQQGRLAAADEQEIVTAIDELLQVLAAPSEPSEPTSPATPSAPPAPPAPPEPDVAPEPEGPEDPDEETSDEEEEREQEKEERKDDKEEREEEREEERDDD